MPGQADAPATGRVVPEHVEDVSHGLDNAREHASERAQEVLAGEHEAPPGSRPTAKHAPHMRLGLGF